MALQKKFAVAWLFSFYSIISARPTSWYNNRLVRAMPMLWLGKEYLLVA
jgi:hypothetical protein